MPAFEKSNVGSWAGTSDDEGSTRWPRASKNFKNRVLISLDFML
jgi:hypothetical protein